MRKGLLILLALLFVGLLASAAVISLLWSKIGFWTLPIVLVLLIAGGWGLKVVIGRAIKKAFMAPFKMKGAVLEGATLTVHRVVAGATEGGRREVTVEATVTPAPNPGTPFGGWDSSELEFVSHGTPAGPPPDSEDDETSPDRIETTEVQLVREAKPATAAGSTGGEDAENEDDEGGTKVAGPARVVIRGKVPAATRRLAVRYYFEVFGDIPL